MAQVSDWSTVEVNNTHLDDLTLSGEGALYTNKIMCAVKKKFDDVDGKLAKVQGAYVFKGTKADMTALEAVTSPSVGDVYSVTALGGENYAWDGTAWDSLGTSDANVVHKTGDETIGGEKTFTSKIISSTGAYAMCSPSNEVEIVICGGRTSNGEHGATLFLRGASRDVAPGEFIVHAGSASGKKDLIGKPDGTLTWNGNAIQVSSDERIKTQLVSVPDDVLDAWGDVQWGQFQFLEAIAAKGASARLHLGLIAQRVKTVFEARGLDACAYGILCHEEREASGDEPAVDLWMVRYEEACAMEAAYQRRRASRLEDRVAALEEALHGVNQ